MRLAVRERLAGYAFVGPFLLAYAAVLVVPLVMGIVISLHRADLFGRREWIGLGNYAQALGDPVLHQALGNTAVLALLIVPPLTVIALLLALALNRPGRFAAGLRGVFFSSLVLSVTIVTLIWRFILTPDAGLIAEGLEAAGRAPIPFLSDPDLVIPAIAVTTLWWSLGFPVMLILAGLQQVPGDIYEAAALDGAGRWCCGASPCLQSAARCCWSSCSRPRRSCSCSGRRSCLPAAGRAGHHGPSCSMSSR